MKTLLRGTLLGTALLLSVALLLGGPGSGGSIVAQSSPSVPAVAPRQASLMPANIVQTGPEMLSAPLGAAGPATALPLYFHGGSGEPGRTAGADGARLVPSAMAARTYSASAAGYRAAHQLDAARPVPADLLLGSPGRLAPYVAPAVVLAQAEQIAAARGLPPASVHALIAWSTDYPLLGLFGQPRVNLRLLNMALDDLAAR